MLSAEATSYEQDVEIDESALDVEWLNQPQKMAKYCRLQAHCQRVMDLAEERVNFVKSTLARDIRVDPAAFDVVPGSRGITEDQIKAATRVQESYRAASRAYIDAKYDYEIARGAVRALENRKASLENLVSLFGRQYFAGPSVPHDLSAERQRLDRERLVNRKIRTPSATWSGERSAGDGAEEPRPRFSRRT